MTLRRRFFLIGIFLVLATGQRADEFKFPLKSNSVRFAAIGDMGTGDKPEFETSEQMNEQRKNFPFRFCTRARRQPLRRSLPGRL